SAPAPSGCPSAESIVDDFSKTILGTAREFSIIPRVIRHSALFFAVALAGAGLDLATKHLAFEHIQKYQEVRVIDGFFSFGRTTNPGVVFGMGGEAKKIWLVISVVAIPVIL